MPSLAGGTPSAIFHSIITESHIGSKMAAKQAGNKSPGTNQTTTDASDAPEDEDVHGQAGKMVFSLIAACDIIKASATSILDTARRDNHRGGAALRTPPLYLHAGKQSSAPLWLQMETAP